MQRDEIRSKRMRLEERLKNTQELLTGLKKDCPHSEKDSEGACQDCGERDINRDERSFLIKLEAKAFSSELKFTPGKYSLKSLGILKWLKDEYNFNAVPKGE